MWCPNHGPSRFRERNCPKMRLVMRKPAVCICQNKDAVQLRGNREADQRLCFRYTDSTITLLLKSEIQASSHLLWLYNPVRVGPRRKSRRPVFSQRGSNTLKVKTHTAHIWLQRVTCFATSTLSILIR